MNEIPCFDSNDDLADICKAMDAAGCVVIKNVLGDELLNSIKSEMAEKIGDAYFSNDDDPEDFYPGKTQRLIGLMQKLPSVRKLAVHPIMTALGDHHLLPNCEKYQLHVGTALVVGPGSREQILHREEDSFEYFAVPRPNLVLASMAAISDFTEANGGTLLVPGSHQWEADRVPQAHEIVAAEMPSGSVLFWLGGTLHGAGSNTTDQWRSGVILTYSLGWLRQEENVYMNLDDATIAALTPELRARLGIDMHGALGFYDPAIRGL